MPSCIITVKKFYNLASMTEKELQRILILKYPKESEHCEWKEFKNLKHAVSSRAGDDIVSYISAIANMQGGELVIGVEDNSLRIIGIENFHSYSPENIKLKLLDQCPNLSSEGFWVESFHTDDTNKTIWVIHVPRHLPRKPVYAHGRNWQRVEDSLVEMRSEREHLILSEPLSKHDDWSASICPGATIDDLDLVAISYARKNFQEKFPKLAADADIWDNVTFLNKAKVLIKGKITNTAIILLGKSETEGLISPAIAKIRWILKDKSGHDKDYQIISCPLLLGAEEAYSKIRNLKYRYMRGGTIFPDEIEQYEPYVIREAINNAIAHQDYSLGGFINVVENEEGFLTFSNLGSFIPGSIDEVIRDNAPEEQYRNPFLAHAMFNLKMVDTIGSGIRRMFEYQRNRFFPLPDYDLSGNKVNVIITGKVLDINYTNVLATNTDLPLLAIMLLDKVQKRRNLQDVEFEYLKKLKLIEGRRPNIFVSAQIAQETGQKAMYSKVKGFDKQYYLDLIIKAIREHQSLTRVDIDELLLGKLPENYSVMQKKNKINNLISELRSDGVIVNQGTLKKPVWVLLIIPERN